MAGKGDKRRQGEDTKAIRKRWPFDPNEFDIPETGWGYPACCRECSNCPQNKGSGICNDCTKNVRKPKK